MDKAEKPPPKVYAVHCQSCEKAHEVTEFTLDNPERRGVFIWTRAYVCPRTRDTVLVSGHLEGGPDAE